MTVPSGKGRTLLSVWAEDSMAAGWTENHDVTL